MKYESVNVGSCFIITL